MRNRPTFATSFAAFSPARPDLTQLAGKLLIKMDNSSYVSTPSRPYARSRPQDARSGRRQWKGNPAAEKAPRSARSGLGEGPVPSQAGRHQRCPAAGLAYPPRDREADQGERHVLSGVPAGERHHDGGLGAWHAVREQLQDRGRDP